MQIYCSIVRVVVLALAVKGLAPAASRRRLATRVAPGAARCATCTGASTIVGLLLVAARSAATLLNRASHTAIETVLLVVRPT